MCIYLVFPPFFHWYMQSFGLYTNTGCPKLHIFSILCTIQYKTHCTLTLFFPRSVNRVSPLAHRKLPNTGSTIAIRLLYIFRPSSVSILAAIRSHYFSPLSDLKKILRTLCFSLVIHCARIPHSLHNRCFET